MILKIAVNNEESLKTLNMSLLEEYNNKLKNCDDKSKHFITSEINKLKKHETYVTHNIHYYRVNGYMVFSNIDFLGMLYPLNIYEIGIIDLIYNNIHLINYKEFHINSLQDFIKHIQQLI